MMIILQSIFYISLFIFCTNQIFSQSNLNQLSGKVSNKQNGTTIEYVNIYLSGTTLGTSTNSKGEYILTHIPEGDYEIVFSAIGFKRRTISLSFNNNKNREHNILMEEEIYSTKLVNVSSERPEQWDENYRLFKTHFLGQSDFTDNCEIENQFYLDFENNGMKSFSASTPKQLIITNPDLGYKITCDLKTFDYYLFERRKKFTLNTFFEDLTKTMKTGKEEILQNRVESYKGSFEHFINSLIENNFQQESFKIMKAENPRKDKNPLREYITHRDSIVTWNSNFNQYLMSFPNYLEVVYNKKDGGVYRSWLYLHHNNAAITKNGSIVDVITFELYGDWSRRGLSSTLPRDYINGM